MFHVQPITRQPYREPGAAFSHVIVGSPLVNERPLPLADHHDAFESFWAPVFCDFVRNYSCTVNGAVVTLLLIRTNMKTINVILS